MTQRTDILEAGTDNRRGNLAYVGLETLVEEGTVCSPLCFLCHSVAATQRSSMQCDAIEDLHGRCAFSLPLALSKCLFNFSEQQSGAGLFGKRGLKKQWWCGKELDLVEYASEKLDSPLSFCANAQPFADISKGEFTYLPPKCYLYLSSYSVMANTDCEPHRI